MKFFTILRLSFIGVGLGLSDNAWADDVVQFQKLYNEFHSAVQFHDRVKILGFLSLEYQGVELSGKTQSAGQMVDEILALPKTLFEEDPVVTVISASGDGKTESVEQTYHFVKSKPDSAGKKASIEFNARSHDIWTFMGDKWLLKSSRTDELEMKKDGIEIFHQKRPIT